MKYTSEYINSLSFKEYLELMAKELNENGFRDVEDGHEYKVLEPPFMRLFMMYPINDPKAMAFLRGQGLIDNGRCPKCGAPMSVLRYTWYDRIDPSKKFHLCYGCYKSNGRGDGKSIDGCPSGIPDPKNVSNSGCMIALLALPIVGIKSLFHQLS